jgi:hypothetical protein
MWPPLFSSLEMARRSAAGKLALLLCGCCALVTGCHLQPKVPPLPPAALTPSLYLPAPPVPNLPPMVDPLPDILPDAAEGVTPTVKAKKPARRPVPAPADLTPSSKPADTTPSGPPLASPLGSLSPGGASTPQQQQAGALIAETERRLDALPLDRINREKQQVSQVRLFLKQATDALHSGDAEGAGNLATKASLLLDDIAK